SALGKGSVMSRVPGLWARPTHDSVCPDRHAFISLPLPMMTQLSLRALGVAALVSGAAADVITIEPVKDNTLFESVGGTLSAGAFGHVFAGRTFTAESIRRGLLKFDLAAAVPAGATINSATLTLTVTNSITGPTDLSLHAVDQDWGEGNSFGNGMGGGQGGAATTGDATWLHTYSPGSLWTTIGGDFAPTPSATASIFFDFGVFTSAGMVTDLQAWLDTPAGNFGWLIKADDESVVSAKRFGSRENGAPTDRPKLEIDYTPAGAGVGTSFCSSLPNSTGSPALLTATGSPNSSLVFTSQPVPNTTGQFFYGPMMLAGAPFGDGLICAGGMTQRMLPFISAGMMMQAPNIAVFTVSYSAPYATGLLGTQHFQHWFRSGLATGAGYNTSDGLQITF
ncbi:MAG: hypothetical protein ACI8QZ_004297, partial [Chlamydiales bacterium]